jgi:ectoine hydroxylase-related dioxygenase (phytanoyl-CoA dioxygenase family)
MTKPELLDVVEDLIGPDIVLWSSALFHKRAHTGGKVNYHRDAEQFPIEPLITPNLWIALTPSTVENGCVNFVPGSHLSQEKGEHVVKPEDEGNEDIMVAIQLKDESQYANLAVPLELEPGEMYIADPFAIHGSGRNNSPFDRTALSVRYFPASSRYTHADVRPDDKISGAAFTHFTGRPLFLVRGKDTGGNDYSIGHSKPNGGLVVG